MNAKGEVLIDVKELKKSFDGMQVLNGISTQICKGEVVAIIGPSGCGKSTFLRSLNLLEIPTGGQILFEGTDITDKSVTLTKCARRSVWCSSSLICFLTLTIKKISCWLRKSLD